MLTFATTRPVYWKLLLKNRPARIVVASVGVVSLLALSLLPLEHVHGARSGAGIVHRHVIDLATEHSGFSLDHGDHRSARTVVPAFESQRLDDAGNPMIEAAVVLLAPELTERPGYSDRIDSRLHGPPIRLTSLRAPPL